MFFIGVDPDANGAVAVIDSKGKFLEVHDCPTYNIGKNGSKKVRVDVSGFSGVLTNIKDAYGPEIFLIMEEPVVMPKQGVVSQGVFMFGAGLIEGCIATLKIPYDKRKANEWKKVILRGLSAKSTKEKKEISVQLARRLFPDTVPILTLKKHHGRAEAILLAEYARRMFVALTDHLKEEKVA